MSAIPSQSRLQIQDSQGNWLDVTDQVSVKPIVIEEQVAVLMAPLKKIREAMVSQIIHIEVSIEQLRRLMRAIQPYNQQRRKSGRRHYRRMMARINNQPWIHIK